MSNHYELLTVSKRILIDAFELTEVEAKLVHRYRNQLPVIIDAEGDEGFCVDLETLHIQLKSPSRFRDWSKTKLQQIEEDDTCEFFRTTESGRIKKGFMVTVDAAKQISMTEKSDVGRDVRKYFVLCEKLMLRIARREPIRQNCKDSTKQLQINIANRIERQKMPKIIAEMNAIICTVATGNRPSAWRKMLGVQNVRDFLKENATKHELRRYDDVNQMAAMLSGNQEMTKGKIKKMLEGCFGPSEIYVKYLNKSGFASFDS